MATTANIEIKLNAALVDEINRLREAVTEAINLLGEVTEQRDRLAEALRKFVGDALFCSHADTATDVLPHRQVDDSGDALTMH